jgi:hypothetical protein
MAVLSVAILCCLPKLLSAQDQGNGISTAKAIPETFGMTYRLFDSIQKQITKGVEDISPTKILQQQLNRFKTLLSSKNNLLADKKHQNSYSSLVNISSADVSNTLSTNPLVLINSTELIVQNSLQSNFSAVLKNRYGFSGYTMYRKTIKGGLPDFFDFHIGYTGKVISKKSILDVDAETIKAMLLKPSIFDSCINIVEAQLAALKSFSVKNQMVDKALAAKETITNYRVDSSYKFIDSATVEEAKAILKLYESFEEKMSSVKRLKDSILLYRDKAYSVIKNGINPEDIDFEEQLSEKFNKKPARLQADLITKNRNSIKEPGITRLSFGRVLPYQSDLTLKNFSLRGVDFNYQGKKYVLAVSGGLIDFRMNDLILKRKIETPLPYAVVLYAGYRPVSNLQLGIRYFNGKKDNYAPGISKSSISGMAFQAIYNRKGKMLEIEAAKNLNSSRNIFDTLSKESVNNFSSENIAVSVKSFLVIPSTKTNIYGYLSVQGKNYNAFNTFNIKTSTKRFEVKVHQDLLNRKLRLTGWIRNTEFTPLTASSFKMMLR